MKVLKLVANRWKRLAAKIAAFQSKVILTIFYFTFLLPLGIVFRLFKDELHLKEKPSTFWVKKLKQSETLEEMRNQA